MFDSELEIHASKGSLRSSLYYAEKWPNLYSEVYCRMQKQVSNVFLVGCDRLGFVQFFLTCE